MSDNHDRITFPESAENDIKSWLDTDDGARYNTPDTSPEMQVYAYNIVQRYRALREHVYKFFHFPEGSGYPKPSERLLQLATLAFEQVPVPRIMSVEKIMERMSKEGFAAHMEAYINQPGVFGTYIAGFFDSETLMGMKVKQTKKHGNMMLIGQQNAMPEYIYDGEPLPFSGELVPCPFTGELPYVMDSTFQKELEEEFDLLIRKGSSQLLWVPANDILAHLRSAALSKAVESYNPAQLEMRNIDFLVYPGKDLFSMGMAMKPFVINTDRINRDIYGDISGVDINVVIDKAAIQGGRDHILATLFTAKSIFDNLLGSTGRRDRKLVLRNPKEVLSFIKLRHGQS